MRRVRSLARLAGLCTLIGCAQPPCPNDVLVGAPSPDGVHIAFIFRRNCGGASGSTTNVSVIDIHQPLRSGAGNVLVVAGEQAVKAAWRGPTTLVVAGFHDPVELLHDHAGGVIIEFPARAGN